MLAAVFRRPPPDFPALLQPHIPALAAALVAAAGGELLGHKTHTEALKQACAVSEAVRKVFGEARAAQVLGPDKVNILAKTIATIKVGCGAGCGGAGRGGAGGVAQSRWAEGGGEGHRQGELRRRGGGARGVTGGAWGMTGGARSVTVGGPGLL